MVALIFVSMLGIGGKVVDVFQFYSFIKEFCIKLFKDIDEKGSSIWDLGSTIFRSSISL